MYGWKSFDEKQKIKIYRCQLFYDYIIRNKKLYKFFILPIILIFITYGLKLIIKNKIDFIQCGSLDFGLAVWFLSRIKHIPYLVYAYGNDCIIKKNSFLSIFWKKNIAYFILKNANIVISISEFTRGKLIDLGISSEKINIIRPCVDTKVFCSYPSVEKNILGKYSLRGKRIILTVSRLVSRKGHKYIIEALRRIIKKVPNAVYMIVGSGENELDLKKLVKKMGLDNKVFFVGRVLDKEKIAFYNICDVFVMISQELPGDVEGFGIVYLEANACSKPVVGSKTGGVSDAIIDGVTGYLVGSKDLNAISNKIIYLLLNKDLAMELGKNGLERVQEEFNCRNNAKLISELMNKIYALS